MHVCAFSMYMLLVIQYECSTAAGQLWAVLVLPRLWRSLFLEWIGPVSQFRPCMHNTDPLITPVNSLSHSLSSLRGPRSLLFNISPTHHYPHCALPTVIHPSFVLPARSIILSILLFRPPGFSFLVLAGNHYVEVVNGTAVFVSLSFRVCVFRGRGVEGAGRGSGLRMWARCLVHPDPSFLMRSWQYQGQ